MIYANPAFYVFLATLTAFILLILTTFSVPLVSTFYFMHSTQANGVPFGMWGWCLDDGSLCSSSQLGFTWQPAVSIPITKALVFYPITVVFTFFTLVSPIPVLCVRTAQSDKIFVISAWISFAFSVLSFLLTIGIWGVAKSRFEERGFSTSYGNLVSSKLPHVPRGSLILSFFGLAMDVLAATLLLLLVALSPRFLGPPPKQSGRRKAKGRIDVESNLPRRPKDHSRRLASESEEK